MPPLKSILIVLDVYHDFRDDPAHQPIEIRKALALVTNPATTTLYLIGCGFEEYLHESYTDFGTDAPARRHAFVEQMRTRLNLIATTLRQQGYTVEAEVHWTYPRYQQIAKDAQALDVDLVVQHVNAQKPAELHNLSHDSWELVKHCQKSLLLVKDNPWTDHPRVLAAVDPCHKHHKPAGLDYAILSTAVDSGEATGGHVHVVHAYSESGLSHAATGRIREVHEAALNELLRQFPVQPENVHLIDDTPVNAILKCRDALHADIVVVGALSRSRVAELIIGNTAERILDYVKSDLYIIRPG